MSFLNELFCGANLRSSVIEKQLSFFCSHQSEQVTGLGKIILILPMVIVKSRSFQFKRRFGIFFLFLPLSIAVWLIMNGGTFISVYPHCSVPVEIMEWTFWFIDRNLIVVHPQPVTLGIAIGEQSGL